MSSERSSSDDFIWEGDLLKFRPWLERQVIHGFTGASYWFKEPYLAQDRERLEVVSGPLIIPHQQHTNEICITADYPSKDELRSKDGVILAAPKGISAAVKTADCLPVLLLSQHKRGAVHAGWRGLASKILTRAAELFREPFEVVIGPAAGKGYEVGREVLEAIGDHAVARPSRAGHLYLDLPHTAVAELSQSPYFLSAAIAPFSTMEDIRWHSHRRQGAKRGSNLAFISF